MTDFDWAMFALVAALGVWGAYHGFVRQATTLGAWSVGVVAAALFRQPVAEWIGGTAPAGEIGAAIIILFASSLVVHLFGGEVRGWIEDRELEGFDQQMGLALGTLKGVALATLVTIAGYHLHEPSRDAIAESITARHVANIVEHAADHVEELLPSPANDWVAEHAREPFATLSDKKQPRRLFVASHAASTFATK